MAVNASGWQALKLAAAPASGSHVAGSAPAQRPVAAAPACGGEGACPTNQAASLAAPRQAVVVPALRAATAATLSAEPTLVAAPAVAVLRAEGSADTKMASWCAMLDARLSHRRGGHLCKSRRARHWEASKAQDLSLHQANFLGPLPDPDCMLLKCTHCDMWRQWQENQPVHLHCPGRRMGGPALAHHDLEDYVPVVCSMVVKKPSTHSPPLAGLLGAWRAH
jgi:hypothetical protein